MVEKAEIQKMINEITEQRKSIIHEVDLQIAAMNGALAVLNKLLEQCSASAGAPKEAAGNEQQPEQAVDSEEDPAVDEQQPEQAVDSEEDPAVDEQPAAQG